MLFLFAKLYRFEFFKGDIYKMAFINWDEYIEKTKPLKEDWFEPEEVGEECFPEVSTFKITNSTIECVMVFDDYGDDLLCVKVIVPYQRQDGKVVIDASNASGLFVDSENHNLYIMADDIAADFDLNDTEAIISEAINNFILTYNNPEVGDSFADKFGCEVLVESCDKTDLTEAAKSKYSIKDLYFETSNKGNLGLTGIVETTVPGAAEPVYIKVITRAYQEGDIVTVFVNSAQKAFVTYTPSNQYFMSTATAETKYGIKSNKAVDMLNDAFNLILWESKDKVKEAAKKDLGAADVVFDVDSYDYKVKDQVSTEGWDPDNYRDMDWGAADKYLHPKASDVEDYKDLDDYAFGEFDNKLRKEYRIRAGQRKQAERQNKTNIKEAAKASGYRIALCDYDDEEWYPDWDEDSEENNTTDMEYLLEPGQTVAGLIIYLSRDCGFTSIYVHDVEAVDPVKDADRIKYAQTWHKASDAPSDDEWEDYGYTDDEDTVLLTEGQLTEGQYGLFQDRFPRVSRSERPKYRKNTKHIWLVIEYDDKTFDLITDYQIANAIKNLFKNPRQSTAASVERIIVPHGDVDMVVYQKNPMVTTQSKDVSNSDYTYNETTAESLKESIPNGLGTLDLIDLQRNHKEDYNSIKNSEEMKNIIDEFLEEIGRYSQTKEYDKFNLSKQSADLATVSKDLQRNIDTLAAKYTKTDESLNEADLKEYHNSSYRFSSLQRDYRNDQKKSDIYYYIEECRPNGVRHAIEGKYGFKKPYDTLDQAKEAAKELSLKSADHLTYAVCNSEDSHLAYYADGKQIEK